MRKEKKKASSKSPLILGIAVGAIIILYLLIGSTYRNVFFPGTIVNGINVSGLNCAQAQEAVNAGASTYTLTLIEDDGENTESISGSDIGLHVENDDNLQLILSGQNMITWGLEAFREKEYSISVSYDEEKLRSVIDSLSCMDKSKWISPENAFVIYENGIGYQIVPEVPGNEISEDRLFEAVADADIIDLGGRRLEALHTPGHSPGHMCFFERETGYLFTGDLVYKDVLFAYYPSTDPEAYLASMERVAALPASRVFPGHHSLDIQPEILTRIRDAFRRLKEEGKLRHGGGQFDCGDFGIWV